MLSKLVNFFWFFLYISNIQFPFLPDKARTRLLVSLVGFVYYLFKFKGHDEYGVSKLVKMILPLALWMFFSIAINSSDQIWFLQYVVLQMIYAVGAVFVIQTGKLYEWSSLLWMMVIYVVIQDTIAFVAFQIPSLTPLLYSIQVPELSADRADELLQIRAIGLGEFGLFGGGIWVAIGLLSLTMLYKMEKIKGIIYIVLFMYMVITGLFVARTSLTGLLSLTLLLVPLKKNWYKALIWAAWGGYFLYFWRAWKRDSNLKVLQPIMRSNCLINIAKQAMCNRTVMI